MKVVVIHDGLAPAVMAWLLYGAGSNEQRYDGEAHATDDLPLDQDVIDAKHELTASPSQVRAAAARWLRPHDFVRIITGPGP